MNFCKIITISAFIFNAISCTLTTQKYETFRVKNYINTHTNETIVECSVSFPSINEKTSIIFQKIINKDKIEYLIVGKFWTAQSHNFNILIVDVDSINYEFSSAIKFEVDNEFLGEIDGAEEEISFKINKSNVEQFIDSKKIQMRFCSRKGHKDFSFEQENLAIIKEWSARALQ